MMGLLKEVHDAPARVCPLADRIAVRPTEPGPVTAVLVRVRPCARADRDHARSRRRYAHVGHVPGPVVCVAAAFWMLPLAHQRGILLHELGHLALAGREHTEADADRAAQRCYGVQIRYRDSQWGRRLEHA